MKTSYILLFAIILFSCGEKLPEQVDFAEPQPVGTSNAKGFNKHFQGTYIRLSDSAALTIQDHCIIKEKKYLLTFYRQDFDSMLQGDIHNNDKIAALLHQDGIKVERFEEDSLLANFIFADTVFSLGKSQLLRFYKGCYFLNNTYDQVGWQVQRLDLHKNELTRGLMLPNDSLFMTMPTVEKNVIRLDSVGQVTDPGQVSFQLKPSRKEFKRMIQQEAFQKWEVWIKIK